MSTMLYEDSGRTVGRHAINVAKTSAEVHAQALPLIEYQADWPHMWRPGDRVYVTLADGQEWVGAALAVSVVTKKILIELL